MEAIIGRAHTVQLRTAATDWLRATRRLSRAALRVAGDSLLKYSTAALMLKAGSSSRYRRL